MKHQIEWDSMGHRYKKSIIGGCSNLANYIQLWQVRFDWIGYYRGVMGT